MKTVIMAGGKGTRIAEINSVVPKPMIPINGRPILEYQLDCLRNQGLTEIVLITGHLGHVIQDYFKDGREFGVTIQYIHEETPLGTAGGLFFLKDTVQDDFLLINGDIIFDINFARFYEFHKSKGGLGTLFTHPNSHPYDSSIIVAGSDGRVKEWLNKEDTRLWYKNCVNAGLHILSPEVLTDFSSAVKLDLDRDILKPMAASGKLYAYHSTEYVKDMGTPERFYSVANDLSTGRVQAGNLSLKQKAVFLDRDGTINRHKGFLTDPDDFELLPGAAEAIRKINESGYLAVVITNQPVIARGELDLEGLETIHNKMETLLGQEGAYLDGIFFCPHHPHKGYEGERPELKIDCTCRKPKPGLLFEAAQKFNIDLSDSWMAGDSEIDMEAGKNAGCHMAFIGQEYASLLDFSHKIIGKSNKKRNH